MRVVPRLVSAFVLCLLAVGPLNAGDLVKDGSFKEFSGSQPAKWTDAKKNQKLSQATVDGKTALQVELIKDGGKSYGEIRQTVKVKRNTLYKFTGQIKATKNAVAFFQLKPRVSGKTTTRMSLGFNKGTDWNFTEKQIDTGSANEIQILCRYRQKGGFVGTTIWYTGVSLVEVGESPNAAAAKAMAENAIKAQRVPGVAMQAGERKLVVAQPGQDIYITPIGAGTKNGSDWKNAASAADGSLQAAWDSAGPGNVVHVGSGTYEQVSLLARAGGKDHQSPITLRGIDTGSGLPIIIGNWSRENPSKGSGFLRIEEEVGYITIENLRLNKVLYGIVAKGLHVGLRINDVDITETRDGIVLHGGATAEAPHIGTHDVIVRDCHIKHYTKRGVRIRDGVSGVRIINCIADAGGKEWAVEDFPIGFSIRGSSIPGVYDHDITYINCVGRNNYQDKGKKYWNADGFTAERNSYNISYINCKAFDNTDGGWDIKARNPVLVNCIALRNKRNFRFWSKPGPALLVNCLAGYAMHRGGTGNANGLHITKGSYVIAERCTFIANGAGVDIDSAYKGPVPTFSEVRNCVFVDEKKPFALEQMATLKVTDSIVSGTAKAEVAGLVDEGIKYTTVQIYAPRADWEGGDGAFNLVGGNDKGYAHPAK